MQWITFRQESRVQLQQVQGHSSIEVRAGVENDPNLSDCFSSLPQVERLQLVDVFRIEVQDLHLALDLDLALLTAEAALELEGEGRERNGPLKLQRDPLRTALQRSVIYNPAIIHHRDIDLVRVPAGFIIPIKQIFFPECLSVSVESAADPAGVLSGPATQQWAQHHQPGSIVLKVEGDVQ